MFILFFLLGEPLKYLPICFFLWIALFGSGLRRLIRDGVSGFRLFKAALVVRPELYEYLITSFFFLCETHKLFSNPSIYCYYRRFTPCPSGMVVNSFYLICSSRRVLTLWTVISMQICLHPIWRNAKIFPVTDY